jgi:hypothetical protein
MSISISISIRNLLLLLLLLLMMMLHFGFLILAFFSCMHMISQFKIALETRNETEASNQIKRMISSSDFDPDYLSLASHEAISCRSINVALTALLSLLDLCIEKTHVVQTKESVILRNIIALTLEQQKDSSAVVSLYNRVRDLLSQMGFDQFFGEGTAGQKEGRWFAFSAWNHGLFCGKSCDWKNCADFFLCASDVLELMVDKSTDHLRSLKTASLLAASSIMAVDVKSDDSLKIAHSYLMKCESVGSFLDHVLSSFVSIRLFCHFHLFQTFIHQIR